MTDEEAGEQADRASAALRDTILQLHDDGLDPQCIVEALVVQAVRASGRTVPHRGHHQCVP
jgi:hypothetical protein